MTRDDTKGLIRKIMNLYPQWNPKDLTETVDDWHQCLKDIDIKDAEWELTRYIQSDKGVYPPSVSVLIPKSQEIYGFRGRVYPHEFFEEIEREAQEAWK